MYKFVHETRSSARVPVLALVLMVSARRQSTCIMTCMGFVTKVRD